MDRLTSVKNPLIQKLRGLKDRSTRMEENMFLVEGQVMMEEALSCHLKPLYLLWQEDVPQTALTARLLEAGARGYEVPRQVLEAVCATRTPQGACCAFSLVQPTPADELGHRLVALDGVQDPGNVGTIWRTADAAGFNGMMLGAGCADPLGPKVQRAGMGSGFRLPFCQCDNLAKDLRTLKEQGYSIVVSALDGEDIYRRTPLGEKFVLVIGSEAHGASQQVKDCATHKLKLPMRGGAESLNAAVAAGVLMYELMREN